MKTVIAISYLICKILLAFVLNRNICSTVLEDRHPDFPPTKDPACLELRDELW